MPQPTQKRPENIKFSESMNAPFYHVYADFETQQRVDSIFKLLGECPDDGSRIRLLEKAFMEERYRAFDDAHFVANWTYTKEDGKLVTDKSEHSLSILKDLHALQHGLETKYTLENKRRFESFCERCRLTAQAQRSKA